MLREQVNEAAERANAHDGNCPDQFGQETDAIGRREVHQAEQVEGNQEQDAEQDRDQYDKGRKSLHTQDITGLDGTCPGTPGAGRERQGRGGLDA